MNHHFQKHHSKCNELRIGKRNKDYKGCKDKDKNGKKCIPWKKGSHNYCRNTNGKKDTIWCKTSETEWEYCDV